MSVPRSNRRPRPTFAEDWLVAVLDSLDEGVIALDAGGHFLAANPSAGRILGFEIDEVRGDPFTSLGLRFVDEAGRALDDDPICHTLATGEPVRGQLVGLVAPRRRWLSVNTQVLADRDRADVVASFTEVTAQVEAQRALRGNLDELERVNEQLRRADALKNDFLAMTSHELRTPLVALLGYGDLLAQHWGALSDDERQEHVATVVRHGRTLLRLVDDLLIAARLGGGTLRADPQPTPLGQLVEEVIGDIPGTEAVAVTADADIVALVDPDHARRITINLVDNALKYGAPPVAVTVRAAGERAQLEVRDAGPGVPADFVPRLFETFSQASQGSARTATGVGLGLAIVAGLVDLNGGAVRYVTAEPQGACFVVELPRGPSEPADSGTATS